MMRFIWPVIVVATVSCMTGPRVLAQAPGVKHVYAFLTERQPGNIMVDDNGRPLHNGPDTIYTVFVETTGAAIQWQSARINGQTYTIASGPVEKTPFMAGTRKGTKEKIYLTAAPGCHLWQLDFDKTGAKPAYRQKAPVGNIMLEGKRGNKKVTVSTGKVIVLDGIPSV